MYVVIPLIMAVVPSLVLVWYYYEQDKNKPEPKGLIVKIFLLGIVVTLPIIIVEIFVGAFRGFFSGIPLLYYLFKAFVVAALCEEWFKFMLIKRYAYNSVHFDEVMDGIVYTIVASLGFACMENILYVIEGGVRVAILRAFSAVPMHAVASGMMGYYIGKAKFAPAKQEERSLLRQGLWLAILLHGLYDFFLFAVPIFGPILGYAIFPLLIWAFINLRGKIKIAIAEDFSAGRAGME